MILQWFSQKENIEKAIYFYILPFNVIKLSVIEYTWIALNCK